LPVRPLLAVSVAVIVKEKEPVAAGVPLNTPALPFNVNPDGRLPELTENV
jgi:hypothetical protein